MANFTKSKSISLKLKMAFFGTFHSVTGDRSRKTPKPSFPCENWGNGKKIDFVFYRVEFKPSEQDRPKTQEALSELLGLPVSVGKPTDFATAITAIIE